MSERRTPGLTLDPGAATVAREAAQLLTDNDIRLAASLSKTLRESGVFELKLVDPSGVRKAAKAIGPIPTSYRAMMADVFELVDTRAISSAVARQTVTRLSETLAELNLSIVTPQLRETISQLDLSPQLHAQITEALGDIASLSGTILTPRIVQAARNAAALAESESAAEAVDDSVARGMRGLSATGRRELQTDVAGLVPALLVVAAILFESKQTELAAAVLVVAAHLMRVYWRLTGKLD